MNHSEDTPRKRIASALRREVELRSDSNSSEEVASPPVDDSMTHTSPFVFIAPPPPAEAAPNPPLGSQHSKRSTQRVSLREELDTRSVDLHVDHQDSTSEPAANTQAATAAAEADVEDEAIDETRSWHPETLLIGTGLGEDEEEAVTSETKRIDESAEADQTDDTGDEWGEEHPDLTASWTAKSTAQANSYRSPEQEPNDSWDTEAVAAEQEAEPQPEVDPHSEVGPEPDAEPHSEAEPVLNSDFEQEAAPLADEIAASDAEPSSHASEAPPAVEHPLSAENGESATDSTTAPLSKKLILPASLVIQDMESMGRTAEVHVSPEVLRDALENIEVSVPAAAMSITDPWMQAHLERLPSDSRLAMPLWSMLQRLSEDDLNQIGLSGSISAPNGPENGAASDGHSDTDLQASAKPESNPKGSEAGRENELAPEADPPSPAPASESISPVQVAQRPMKATSRLTRAASGRRIILEEFSGAAAVETVAN